jgi:hypothetical protein
MRVPDTGGGHRHLATRAVGCYPTEPMADSGDELPFAVLSLQTETERNRRAEFARLFRSAAIPEEELLANLGLFMRRQHWARCLFMHDLYRRALDVHGVVMEFGTRWGQNLALFSVFRGLYEPFNYTRHLVGFDTFTGFPGVSPEDGTNPTVSEGAYSVTEGWEQTLEKILLYHEGESPISHLRKFELVKGDVSETLPRYLERHPETVVALAYFDMDIYKPTRDALTSIRPHLTRGSVIGFDEACFAALPGETVALREVLGLGAIRLQRVPYSPTTSFLIWEG